MPAPSVLPGRAYQNTSRKSQLLFHFRASDLALTTVSGDDGTFSRSSVAGMVTQRGLPWADSTSGIRLGDEGAPQQPSWGYFLNSATGLYEPALVLGRAYTNLVASDDFDAGWGAAVGGGVATAGAHDPEGGATAYTISGDGSGTFQGRTKVVVFTGDGAKSAIFVIAEKTMPASGAQRLQIRDTTLSENRCMMDITSWVAGEPQITEGVGTLLGMNYCGDGYWAILVQTTAITVANTNTAYVLSNTAASAGSIDVWRVNAYNDAVPPPYILSASVARTADSLTFPYLAEPQAATYLYEGIVADLPNQGTRRELFRLGNATGTNRHLTLLYDEPAGRLKIYFGNGVASVSGYWLVSLALGDRITVRFQQLATGEIDAVGLTINGGAEDTTLDAAFGAPIALPGAWETAYIAFAGTNVTANSALTKFVAAAGSWSTTQMRQMF